MKTIILLEGPVILSKKAASLVGLLMSQEASWRPNLWLVARKAGIPRSTMSDHFKRVIEENDVEVVIKIKARIQEGVTR
jgi:hypothetical protein